MLKPGDRIGPYEIRGFLGQGGMGSVYQAFDPRLERTVALKVITSPPGESPDSAQLVGEFSNRLLREARAVASLSHPNVVGIFDVGESDGRLFLAMEYVVGSTLRTLVTSTEMRAEVSLAKKIRWLVDVAHALDAAHRAGLVHRDVKPENVMVREDGTIKVVDFGIARRTTTSDEHAAIETVTGSGSIAGTPVYMAPEQIKGSSVDARCDQFAWGVVAFELLSGKRPWGAEPGDMLALVGKILTEPAPSLRALVPDVPALVEETIVRALAKDPAARFASMAEIAGALEPFAIHSSHGDRIQITPGNTEDSAAYAATTRVPTSVSLPPPSIKKPRERKRRRSRSRVFQLAVPLVLIGALGAAVYVVRKRTGHVTPPPDRPLSAVPEAEAAYKDAMRLFHDGATQKMAAALKRATDLDPTFAAAHLEIAIQTAQHDPTVAQAEFQSAFEFRHMLLPRDAALLHASEPYVRPAPDLDEWETRLTSVVFQFPRDAELQLYLGRARERQGEDDAAKAAYLASARIDPTFVPAAAAVANVERNLGQEEAALAATDRCIKQSPIASLCVEARYRLFFEMGECHKAREQAASWRTLEPQSPEAFAALARTLYADGAPRPSVEETLSHRWGLLPPPDRRGGELWDRMYLAVGEGEFDRAEGLARDYESELAASADQYDHARPLRARLNIFIETNRWDDAAKTAHDYLDRMDAWAPYAFAPDPSLSFYEPLFRSGAIPKADLDRQRAQWIEREKRRLPGRDPKNAESAWLTWNSVWGSFAETREEANEALARLPAGIPLPEGSRRSIGLDFSLGKAHALAGHPAEALTHLLKVTASCGAFEDAMLITRARFYIGIAYEARGETALAKGAYARVLETWPATTKSRTALASEMRLKALAN